MARHRPRRAQPSAGGGLFDLVWTALGGLLLLVLAGAAYASIAHDAFGLLVRH